MRSGQVLIINCVLGVDWATVRRGTGQRGGSPRAAEGSCGTERNFPAAGGQQRPCGLRVGLDHASAADRA